MWAQSLGEEDPLEEGMATHSIILAWRIPWTEDPAELQSWSQRVGHYCSDLAHMCREERDIFRQEYKTQDQTKYSGFFW